MPAAFIERRCTIAGIDSITRSGCGRILVWNFPTARIFMGDAGSGFLGLILGILALEASWVSFELFWGG